MSSMLKRGKESKGAAVKPLSLGLGYGLKATNGKGQTLQAASKESVKIIALQAEVEKLKSDIEQLKIETEQAVTAAREGGRKEALETTEKAYDKAYETLSKGVDSGLSKLNDCLSSLDGLALLISQTVLEKFFVPNEDYRDTITRMVRRQIDGIRRETILQVRVSSQDFESDEALEDLAFALDLRQADIKIAEKIRQGECIIDLRLGHMELSVNDQWDEMKTLFQEMLNDEEHL